MRVSLAAISWNKPDVILLDEPTNHCDMSALDALSSALAEFPGAVLVVSHNRAFLNSCCNELWEVDRNSVRVQRGDDFAELFAAYTRKVFKGTGGVALGSDRGGEKSNSAKIKNLDKKRASQKVKGIAAKDRGGFI